MKELPVFKPYNLNRDQHADAPNAIGRIEYSEKGINDYDAYMIVEMAGLPLPSAASQPYAVESMKMFVGKKGQIVDVIGNSNHPNAKFNFLDNETKGFDWAFVASGNTSTNIAVAEVGLPPSSADISDRSAILVDNSIKKVLTREMTNYLVAAYATIGITLRPDEIANYLTPYLKNADAPGYFNGNGFVKGGTAPNGSYSELESRINLLAPYNPVEIRDLQIEFNY